jgi:hypothetical protein
MDNLDRYLDNLSVPYYTSRHPVHGPYNPNRNRCGFMQQADNEADMRQYLEEQVREQLVEEEGGGDSASYDGSRATAANSTSLANHNIKNKTFSELVDMFWSDIDSNWNPS